MNHGKMKLFSLLMVPLFVALSFAAAKTTLVQADSSVSSIQEIESVGWLMGPSVPSSGLAFEATSAATGSLTISGVSAGDIDATSALVTWDTVEPVVGDSRVRYGISTNDLVEATAPATGTTHTVGLTDLTPATTYFYEVESTDIDGFPTVDNKGGSFYDFTTVAATGSLTITGVRVSNLGATFATIEWKTDDPGNSVVRYDTTDPLSLSSLRVTVPVTATNHVVSLIDLDPGTKYFYEVKSTDIDGIPTVDGLHSFTTNEVVKPDNAAMSQRRAFVGTVVLKTDFSVVLMRQGTKKEATILLPLGGYSMKTPGGERAGVFKKGASVVILAENVGGVWEAIWVMVKPIKHVRPVYGAVTGIGPTSITITDPDGTTHLIRLTGQAKKAAEDLEIGEVVTVLRGNGNRGKGLVTANQVRDRMLADIEENEAEEDEGEADEAEKKFKSKRADALIRGLERLGRHQLRVLGRALDRAPEHVKERLFNAKSRMEERIKVAKEASNRARGRFKIFESGDSAADSDGEDNSGPGKFKNRGRGKAGESEAGDSPGNSGKSGKENRGGKGNSGRGGRDSSGGR